MRSILEHLICCRTPTTDARDGNEESRMCPSTELDEWIRITDAVLSKRQPLRAEFQHPPRKPIVADHTSPSAIAVAVSAGCDFAPCVAELTSTGDQDAKPDLPLVSEIIAHLRRLHDGIAAAARKQKCSSEELDALVSSQAWLPAVLQTARAIAELQKSESLLIIKARFIASIRTLQCKLLSHARWRSSAAQPSDISLYGTPLQPDGSTPADSVGGSGGLALSQGLAQVACSATPRPCDGGAPSGENLHRFREALDAAMRGSSSSAPFSVGVSSMDSSLPSLDEDDMAAACNGSLHMGVDVLGYRVDPPDSGHLYADRIPAGATAAGGHGRAEQANHAAAAAPGERTAPPGIRPGGNAHALTALPTPRSGYCSMSPPGSASSSFAAANGAARPSPAVPGFVHSPITVRPGAGAPPRPPGAAQAHRARPPQAAPRSRIPRAPPSAAGSAVGTPRASACDTWHSLNGVPSVVSGAVSRAACTAELLTPRTASYVPAEPHGSRPAAAASGGDDALQVSSIHSTQLSMSTCATSSGPGSPGSSPRHATKHVDFTDLLDFENSGAIAPTSTMLRTALGTLSAQHAAPTTAKRESPFNLALTVETAAETAEAEAAPPPSRLRDECGRCPSAGGIVEVAASACGRDREGWPPLSAKGSRIPLAPMCSRGASESLFGSVRSVGSGVGSCSGTRLSRGAEPSTPSALGAPGLSSGASTERALQGNTHSTVTSVDKAPSTGSLSKAQRTYLPVPLYDTLDGSASETTSTNPTAQHSSSGAGGTEESYVQHTHGLTVRGMPAHPPASHVSESSSAPLSRTARQHSTAAAHSMPTGGSAPDMCSSDGGQLGMGMHKRDMHDGLDLSAEPSLTCNARADSRASASGELITNELRGISVSAREAGMRAAAATECAKPLRTWSHSGALTPRLMDGTVVPSHAILKLTPLTSPAPLTGASASPDLQPLSNIVGAPGPWLLGDSSSELEMPDEASCELAVGDGGIAAASPNWSPHCAARGLGARSTAAMTFDSPAGGPPARS
eukprot:jgi/Ulvmu1/9380/UM051_0007.1